MSAGARSSVVDAPMTVAFEPYGVTVPARAGASLADLAGEAGVMVETPCGGQGRCGRCKVRLADPAARSALRERSTAHLRSEEQAEGYVLACQTFVTDGATPQAARTPGSVGASPAATVTVIVPRLVKRAVFPTGHGAAKPEALPVSCDWRRHPAVSTYVVELTPPSLADQTTDFDRLRREMSRQFGIDDLRAEIEILKRLARTLREADWKVAVTLEMRDWEYGFYLPPRVIDLRPASEEHTDYGLAVDLGTTSVVAYLIDFASAHVVDTASAYNAQVAHGDDVISRIVYSQRGQGLYTLGRLATSTINELIRELAARNDFQPNDIQEVVVAGNTTMTHLLLGLDPKYLREEPYVPTLTRPPKLLAGELDFSVNPLARVHCLPSVGSYVGGDITAGVISSGMFATDLLTLFIDVGTNGEIVLGDKDWLISCACSAGPAFEGGEIDHGMRASTGAIEDVWISAETFEPTYRTIDNTRPQGICGSGLIDLLAELFVTGLLDKGGRFDRGAAELTPRMREGEHGYEYVVAWARETAVGHDIVLTESDVGSLVRAKAAIYAGFSVLCHSVGIELAAVEQILIGGAFGQYISVEKAIQIGLLPDLPVERFHFLGNTSALGAYMALLCVDSRHEALDVANKMTYLELSADNSFMEEYTSALFLPHTDLGAFPSVKAPLEDSAVRPGGEPTANDSKRRDEET
jgi:uncharacterized 2Fe-2S/4Fe-4S cluster protein (DUF4445 family)